MSPSPSLSADATATSYGIPDHLVNDGFLTVLPTKKTGLPLLSALTTVHICLSDGSAHLVADAGEHSMSFTIKVDPQGCRSKLAPDIHDDMEQLTDTSDSIVELTVMNVGDLKISGTDLDGLLCSLPKLKILSVFSVRPPAGDDLASLEDELMETAEFHDGCEALEELNLNCLKPSDDEKLIDNLEMWLRHRSSQGMRLKHLRIELAGRGESTNLGDAEQAAREARFVGTLRPLVDTMECAHRILVQRNFEVRTAHSLRYRWLLTTQNRDHFLEQCLRLTSAMVRPAESDEQNLENYRTSDGLANGDVSMKLFD